jgi:hypothetical protein
MERIEGIKILHVEGLHAGGAANGEAGPRSIADQAVEAALRYRTQAPLLDALMRELGLSGTELSGNDLSSLGAALSDKRPGREG